VPEGDTIFRAARALDQALAGRPLVRFEAPRLQFRPFAPGAIVDGAEAVGKHCLIHFDDGRILHTHMRMTGSWHLYKPGERWRKRPSGMRALVEVPDWVAVCFAAPVVELTTEAPVEHLGPDLCRPDPDIADAVRRMGELSRPERTIGEALLDQRIAAGIGNIWKNEACFTCGVDPFTPVGQLDDAARARLLETAGRQLRANLTTTDRAAIAVYGRRDQPCRRCGATIRWAPQGEQRRGTYWCPACQPEVAGSGAG
jgi:endonuclease-8